VAPAPAAASSVLNNCVTKLSGAFHQVATYQPGYRYWPFQWIELGIFIAAAVALSAFCIWWVKRRLS
jgi:hypothetical protein